MFPSKIKVSCDVWYLSCCYRDILLSVTDQHGLDLSQCQVVLLSQPDVLPNLGRPAVEFANQSVLVLSPTRPNASTETVINYLFN